jgi:hypothetical protein
LDKILENLGPYETHFVENKINKLSLLICLNAIKYISKISEFKFTFINIFLTGRIGVNYSIYLIILANITTIVKNVQIDIN